MRERVECGKYYSLFKKHFFIIKIEKRETQFVLGVDLGLRKVCIYKCGV